MSEPVTLSPSVALGRKFDAVKSFAFLSSQVKLEAFEASVTAIRVSQFLGEAADLLASDMCKDKKREVVRAVLDVMKLGRERKSNEIATAMVGRSLASIYSYMDSNRSGLVTEFATYRDIYPGVATLVGPVVQRQVDPGLVEVKLAKELVHTAGK